MATARSIATIFQSKPAIEGAGVHLRRAFGYNEVPLFDPFLLLDDFRSDGNPGHYLKGFPWHPHRGIETITYMIEGSAEHGDSMGNTGVIGPGDVQWMTAGSGIIHQEMPQGDGQGRMGGFQLWANLPASHKMMAPRYRGITAGEIPKVTMQGGVEIRVICGSVAGKRGPVQDIVTDPEYLDITVPAGAAYVHPTSRGRTVFAYIFQGTGGFWLQRKFASDVLHDHTLVLFKDGDSLEISAADSAFRFLLVSGRPVQEPVAWYGPIVMNTDQELQTAFEEYENGTFIKQK
jgi:hypothetical protein